MDAKDSVQNRQNEPCPRSVLLIEDDRVLLNQLQDFLGHAGFTTTCFTPEKPLLTAIETLAPDLILLNLRVEFADGAALFAKIRKHYSDLPMVVLIAHMEIVGELSSNEEGENYCAGITDYVAKPYSPRLIVSRIQAILDAQAALKEGDSVAGRWVEYDESLYQVTFLDQSDDQIDRAAEPSSLLDAMAAAGMSRNRSDAASGRTLTLTQVEFKLLQTLESHPFRIFSREELMRTVYADQRYVDELIIDRHMTNLGAKLMLIFPNRSLIRLVGGVGYRLEKP